MNPDIEEMMMVWEKAEKNNIKLNSPTLLASLLRFFIFYAQCTLIVLIIFYINFPPLAVIFEGDSALISTE